MILCAGEALIDMLPRETTAGEPAFAPYAGGAVFNTAIALGRLGQPTGFLTGLSSDLFGKVLGDTLTAADVDARFAIRSDRPTTLAFVTLTDGHATYAFYDENTAGRMIAPEDLPPLPDTVSALFLGGISLAVEPCAAAYEALLEREGASRVTMIDPNIRPGFIRDEARFRARMDRMLAAADIVKISDEDLAWLGFDVAMLLANGPKVVCITEGAKGVTAHTTAGQVHVAATRVTVVDTVGAGDTFNAGFLAGLSQDGLLTRSALAGIDPMALVPALDLGARAAAVTVSRAGANPPWQHEL
ncbi:carbohydrate kinase [Maritimibacter sp. DP1N21-5]|uniref:carbohydrate kinase family protein n=1 Tax=Maritimibacter sp. DP1N21-5 TaxID=2836867 RepID=UPI001C440748|nr:carbohydrate kinase [Maritimibacter sp. DP1N21-5]MBV7409120.1 carbohydrate kinase [Maritimibacter sp. DP1N21-5]